MCTNNFVRERYVIQESTESYLSKIKINGVPNHLKIMYLAEVDTIINIKSFCRPTNYSRNSMLCFRIDQIDVNSSPLLGGK